ncbi:MAG: D-aminoacyl-tRNA deacylase [Thermoplasmata archaeon]|nr:D-aminoacyl-tRNA deacylase [Thermoplasmata archaeon]
MPALEYLVVLSEGDPVARAVGARLDVGPSVGALVDGTPLRALGGNGATLRRPGIHIRDDDVDQRLPPDLRTGLTLIFPSIHRSAAGQHGLTVHPLGNPTGAAEVGGRPRRLVPTSPRLMATVLRRLAEGGERIGWSASYEATHHGPSLGTPAFFAEIGFGEAEAPPEETVELLAKALVDVVADPSDRIVIGVGGGHYAPHFTELALERRAAFGHIFARHVLEDIDDATRDEARAATPGSEGIVYARSADVTDRWQRVAPRIRDAELPSRGSGTIRSSSSRSRDGGPGSGT